MPPESNLLGQLQRVAARLLPQGLLNRLDPVESTIAQQVQSFARSLPDQATVLDAGAGEARFRPHFSRQHYLALDNRQGDPAWDYSRLDVVGDLLDLPLRQGSCDALLSVVVLEHTRDPARVIREAWRVLRPGGRMMIVVPLIWEVHQAPNDFFRFTSYGLESLLADAGFEVTTLLPIGGFFWVVARYSFYFLKFFRQGLLAVFLPLLAPFFGLLIPLICYYLNPLDHTGQYPLGYVCEARRPG